MIAAARTEAFALLPAAAAPELTPASLASVPHPAYEVAKRTFDIAVASLLLVTLSPLLLVTFVIVRVTSPGPVIFRQMRSGRDGALFTCFKFRTMVSNAPEVRETLLSSNEHYDGPVFKIRRDPRVTGVGGFLRKTSIDELPQLWNVLRGDMSLVGPRPPLPEEVMAYTPREYVRLSVRPGMTGLWQVSGRSTLSFERWMELDLEYVRTRSFMLDLRVLLLTVPAVVTGRGAW
ncbi:MAG: sugar transferase [Dehalococcoidia bacterium]|nr:sugar transferase [Dehalococcoidia bacterium]